MTAPRTTPPISCARISARAARGRDLHSQWRQGQCAECRAWPMPAATWWWRWTPTPSSTPTRFRGWCAGSPIPQIGAVAGNAKVGNRINMITRWQALEYIVAQNLERRALSALDTLTVVPGAVGRLAARGAAASWAVFPPTRWPKTRISPSPSRPRAIACSSIPRAIAWTEAPATVRGLAKQRFRWAYRHAAMSVEISPHHLQSATMASWAWWRCRRSGCSRSCSPRWRRWPICCWSGSWSAQWINYSQHGAEFTRATICSIVGIYYVVFIVVDLLAAMVGFVMETARGLAAVVVAAAATLRLSPDHVLCGGALASRTALRGPFVGWGKLERHGTVKARA